MLDLEGTRIDLREQISFVDELSFLECNTGELTIHAAANRNGVEGRHRAEAIEINRQVATLGSRNHDGHNHAARAEAALTLAGCSGGGSVS